MSTDAVEHHRKAAEHFASAAKHHNEAATHYGAGTMITRRVKRIWRG